MLMTDQLSRFQQPSYKNMLNSLTSGVHLKIYHMHIESSEKAQSGIVTENLIQQCIIIIFPRKKYIQSMNIRSACT